MKTNLRIVNHIIYIKQIKGTKVVWFLIAITWHSCFFSIRIKPLLIPTWTKRVIYKSDYVEPLVFSILENFSPGCGLMARVTRITSRLLFMYSKDIIDKKNIIFMENIFQEKILKVPRKIRFKWCCTGGLTSIASDKPVKRGSITRNGESS